MAPSLHAGCDHGHPGQAYRTSLALALSRNALIASEADDTGHQRQVRTPHSGLIPAAFRTGSSRASSASRNALISAGEVGQGVAPSARTSGACEKCVCAILTMSGKSPLNPNSAAC